MTQLFQVIEVPGGSEERVEQLGTKAKFWFRHEELGWCLCKFPRPNTGEDWAEKVAAEVARGLGLPHARYELADYGKANCVVSPRFLPASCTMVHGNELLGEADPTYVESSVSPFRQKAHTLEAIWDALEQTACELPLDWDAPPGIRTPGEVFTGYLLLDVLIGNTDRHHENWGLVEAPEDATARRHLAPTFDHASCLGCHLTEGSRRDRMKTKDRGFSVEAFADKARSALFSDKTSASPMLTLEAFGRSAERWPNGAQVWVDRLRSIRPEFFDRILASLPPPRCSESSRRFAHRILLHNVERVLAAANGK